MNTNARVLELLRKDLGPFSNQMPDKDVLDITKGTFIRSAIELQAGMEWLEDWLENSLNRVRGE